LLQKCCLFSALRRQQSAEVDGSVTTRDGEAIMKRTLVTGALGGLSLMAVPSVAAAQVWVPGSEIAGQSAQVTTNGVTNTVYFDERSGDSGQ